MSFSVIDEIYKGFSDNYKDTEDANAYFKELHRLLSNTLSIDLQDKIYKLIDYYTCEIREQSFKTGFKYAAKLYKEI